jgi:hypothetical protein
VHSVAMDQSEWTGGAIFVFVFVLVVKLIEDSPLCLQLAT